jgi:hypothetical protein
VADEQDVPPGLDLPFRLAAVYYKKNTLANNLLMF